MPHSSATGDGQLRLKPSLLTQPGIQLHAHEAHHLHFVDVLGTHALHRRPNVLAHLGTACQPTMCALTVCTHYRKVNTMSHATYVLLTMDDAPTMEALSRTMDAHLKGTIVGACRIHAGCSHKRTMGRKPRATR
jgi:hypothetical protein